jgi:hypothetical protein
MSLGFIHNDENKRQKMERIAYLTRAPDWFLSFYIFLAPPVNLERMGVYVNFHFDHSFDPGFVHFDPFTSLHTQLHTRAYARCSFLIN